jgi:hypothetical protein
MNAGICTMPLLPVRSEPSEQSEMTTQLLFGELFEVLEEKDSWSRIKNITDGYTGWATTKMLLKLSPAQFKELATAVPYLSRSVVTPCFHVGETIPRLFLPAGSRLYDFDKTLSVFSVYRSKTIEKWYIETRPNTITNSFSSTYAPKSIIDNAFCFSHAPYLWGGKSIFGMDCSGLVQIVFSFLGINLPRDARDQALIGEPVPDLSAVKTADLAFFANTEGKVVHVGIVIDSYHIIHASGYVHFDTFDQHGIYSEKMKQYTHTLCGVRRVL